MSYYNAGLLAFRFCLSPSGFTPSEPSNLRTAVGIQFSPAHHIYDWRNCEFGIKMTRSTSNDTFIKLLWLPWSHASTKTYR